MRIPNWDKIKNVDKIPGGGKMNLFLGIKKQKRKEASVSAEKGKGKRNMKKRQMRLVSASLAMAMLFACAITANAEGAYTVKKGDNLSKIAKEVFGDQKQWRKIYDANKDTVKNPNTLHVGQQLVLPDGAIVPAETPAEEGAAQLTQEEVQAPEEQVAAENTPTDSADTLIVPESDAVHVPYYNQVGILMGYDYTGPHTSLKTIFVNEDYSAIMKQDGEIVIDYYKYSNYGAGEIEIADGYVWRKLVLDITYADAYNGGFHNYEADGKCTYRFGVDVENSVNWENLSNGWQVEVEEGDSELNGIITGDDYDYLDNARFTVVQDGVEYPDCRLVYSDSDTGSADNYHFNTYVKVPESYNGKIALTMWGGNNLEDGTVIANEAEKRVFVF